MRAARPDMSERHQPESVPAGDSTPREATPEAADFDLFISHSSADNLVVVHGRQFRLIDELKDKLEEHYHPSEKVGGRPRRFRACTYEEDFEFAGDVSTAIRERIRASRALLVISSTAASLPVLASLTRLERLNLERTRISPEGADALRRDLPDTTITLSSERTGAARSVGLVDRRGGRRSATSSSCSSISS